MHEEELKELFKSEMKGLRSLFNEKFDTNEKAHEELITQTKKTNGRVSALENWKNRVIGALIMTNIIFVPIILIIVKRFIW